MSIERLLTLAVVGWAACYVAVWLWRSVAHRSQKSCGGCAGSCGSGESPPLVALSTLPETKKPAAISDRAPAR